MSALTLAVVLGAIAILIFCSALFSRVQTALSLLKPHQLRRLEENHAGLRISYSSSAKIRAAF
jgi:Putative Mg2+ and Co2+ transporter CorB